MEDFTPISVNARKEELHQQQEMRKAESRAQWEAERPAQEAQAAADQLRAKQQHIAYSAQAAGSQQRDADRRREEALNFDPRGY